MLLTAVITLVTVLLASLLPFSYLKTELRTDIENYNNQRLLHVKNTVDSTALSPVAAAFSDIVLSNQVSQASGFSGVGEDIKSSGLYSIYGLLGRKNVQYSLTDIALYNPRSKVLLSATYGITYLSGTTVKLTSDVSWVEEIGLIPSGTRSAIWLAPRAFPDGSWQAGENHLLSLIAPLNSGERNGLYACVSISDAVLMNAVESAGRSPDTKYFLLSLNGDLIAGQPEETILEELQNQSDELRKATGNDISIQDIADELGISRYHLCRVFKESQGMTLLEYIAEIRMRHAKQLLEETDLSVSEVARQVGFNNVTYFHKRFKQSFGITPNQIRKN